MFERRRRLTELGGLIISTSYVDSKSERDALWSRGHELATMARIGNGGAWEFELCLITAKFEKGEIAKEILLVAERAAKVK